MTQTSKTVKSSKATHSDELPTTKNLLLTKTIKDNFMFGAVMTEGDNCKILLEMVLHTKLASVDVRWEYGIVYNPKFHGVRLDILAIDDNGTRYNIEMQTVREYTELRARYYHSQMDMELLRPGHDYDELAETFVIFICDYDPLNLGKFVYNVRNRCDEAPEYDYRDGAHTIFLSTKGKNRDEVEPELLKFLDYVNADLTESTQDFKSDYVRQLQQSIEKVRYDREKVGEYMTLECMLADERRKSRQEGEAKGIAETTDKFLRKQLSKNPSLVDARDMFDELSEDYIRNFAHEHNIRLEEP